MHFSPDREEFELRDEPKQQLSSRSSEDGARAEEQGLLGGIREEDAWSEDDWDFIREEKQSRQSWLKRHLWLAGISAALLAGLALAALVLGKTEEALGVQTNDYILDRNWDFDAAPQRREYDFVVRDQMHNPDGVWRLMILVNNQFPGPLIEANEGDTIVVHVHNQAVNATSIHWHGMYQRGTPHMDGTAGVTQCPIAPGGSFTYEFTVAGQSGTYWWHGHVGLQSSDGLHGPLIIHHRKEKEVQKVQYDTEQVILLSDHYHDLSSALLWQYLRPDMENAEPVPQGGLINGRSIRNCDDFPDRQCDNSSSHVGMPELEFAFKQRRRLRIINTGAFAEFQFQIDAHQLTVTEVDGTDVFPEQVHRLSINPAQRYSVVVNALRPREKVNTYWLRARMVTTCFTDPPKTLQVETRAIVRYRGRYEEGQPDSRDWGEVADADCRDMNTTSLIPVEASTPPQTPDSFFYLRSNFEIGAYRLSRGFFNSSSWRVPDIHKPSLARLVDGLDDRNLSFTASSLPKQTAWINTHAFDPKTQLSIQTEGPQTIDILFSNFDDGTHPLHLHGYKYFVLAQGHGHPPLTSIDAEINLESLDPLYRILNLTNPIRRDTASVEAFGWILIRIVADNPGAWLLHCHVSWHGEAGLAMQLLTRTDELNGGLFPDEYKGLCEADGIEKGMGPRDEDYWDIAK
ncbi:multicopper oxidase [Polychaeton citri CBS 116435]|uniref:Multicopper oxidase n=1 Tax=Polychaeton citri CBS 116435 TaxID=1314669 RepID=A0A9P4QBF0_9PEZI|nr:multicopper oxidase [Polychaeton citri CBS 116435]